MLVSSLTVLFLQFIRATCPSGGCLDQVVGGKVVANTVSVTEERKTEEIHDTPQSAKGAVSAAAEDSQPHVVDVTVAGNQSAPTPVAVVDQGPALSTSPASSEASPPPISPPESTDGGGKKDKQQNVGGRFSLFGKKKKKSSSEAEDLKNVSAEVDAGNVDNRQKRSSLGNRKMKSPTSADAPDGEGGKRASGGPFGFLKRNKAKPCSKVPSSESAPTLDLDEEDDGGHGGDAGGRIVYELEVEGNVVAKVRPKSSSSSGGRQSGTAVATVDDAPATLERPVEAGRHLVVVAIDFGTTFSGYAFSFVSDAATDGGESPAPDGVPAIRMMRRWEGGDPGVINQKTLTALLLTPEGQFHAFGFTARNFYHDLDPTEAQRWMYFDKFKMALHNNRVMPPGDCCNISQ